MKNSRFYQRRSKGSGPQGPVTRLTIDSGAKLAWERISPKTQERLRKNAKDVRNIEATKASHLYSVESDGVRILFQTRDGKVTGNVVSVVTEREMEALRA